MSCRSPDSSAWPGTIFVATRREDVPAGLHRYASVDGAVPGAVVTWDHHQTGERINLDAMPDEIDPSAFDGVGTTLADVDAMVSVVALLLGGRAKIPAAERAIVEAASHWCDHLAPHPAHDAESNRLGRGLLDAFHARVGLPEGGKDVAAFGAMAREVAERVRAGEPLPFDDRFAEQVRRAERLAAEGRLRFDGEVAIVDLRGFGPLDPLAVYQLHDRPVGVTVEEHRNGGIKYTVGVNPRVPHPSDLRSALAALAAAEAAHGPPARGPRPEPGCETWGGRATVFGSPWNYGSRLTIEEVVAAVKACAAER